MQVSIGRMKFMSKKKLTSLQKKFCDILILMEISGKVNQGEALRLAGSKCKAKAAEAAASRMLRNVKVSAYLAGARARNSRATEKTQEKTKSEIIREYEIMAFARPADYYHADGTPKKIKELTKAQRAALRSITVVEHHYKNKKGKEGKTVKTEYSMQPKKPSLDSLARIKGLMTSDTAEVAKSIAAAMHEAMKDKEKGK